MTRLTHVIGRKKGKEKSNKNKNKTYCIFSLKNYIFKHIDPIGKKQVKVFIIILTIKQK